MASMGQRSHINLALNAGNLHEVETIARIFLPPARPLGLYRKRHVHRNALRAYFRTATDRRVEQY